MSDDPGPSSIQHEQRFAQVDRDISEVKTEVGVLQENVRTLRAGQTALQESQDRGFTNIQETLRAKGEEQPKISVGMLMSVIGLLVTIGVVGIGAFWSVVVLLVTPLREEAAVQKTALSAVTSSTTLLAERSLQLEKILENQSKIWEERATARHHEHSEQITRLQDEVAKLHSLVLAMTEREAENRGKQEALHSTFREAIQRLEERERTTAESLYNLRGAMGKPTRMDD